MHARGCHASTCRELCVDGAYFACVSLHATCTRFSAYYWQCLPASAAGATGTPAIMAAGVPQPSATPAAPPPVVPMPCCVNIIGGLPATGCMHVHGLN